LDQSLGNGHKIAFDGVYRNAKYKLGFAVTPRSLEAAEINSLKPQKLWA